ncbi:HEPN domain-containing protein [Kutzneria sp. CA-103260]|uniref:HEPN domain-containing protein n=1 Tax=Kutzneria sp. CA-103260 TaxID=2802641 RepID=UPI001BAB1D33|nr:HEPN domain-containing protein [Kutzneria sp. CA-103260]QUQ66067.1 Apea-like HEPN [Kutzneria sp. CA-103260]
MEQLRKAFGEKFLCYVLACDPPALALDSWSEAQRTVVESLTSMLDFASRKNSAEQHFWLVRLVLAWEPNGGMSLANAWRSMCGGDSAVSSAEGDECLNALSRMARDVYPGFLIPHQDQVYGMSTPAVTSVLLNHRDCGKFNSLALTDKRLKKLFPGVEGRSDSGDNKDNLREVQSVIQYSLGKVGGLQLALLANFVLRSAFDRTIFFDIFGLQCYLRTVVDVLEDVRKLADGKEVKVPALLGLTNIQLSVDGVLNLPWGKLCRPSQVDARFLSTDEDQPTVVLVTKVPMKIVGVRKWKPGGEEGIVEELEQSRPHFNLWNREVQRTIDLTRYALLLASHDGSYAAASHFSTCVLDPLSAGLQKTWGFKAFNLLSEITLSVAMESRVVEWAEKISHQPHALDVAMRRTLSAMTERPDPLDGFIDAVLAWENMFSGSPETTLRVCGSIAALLEPGNPERRDSLFRELKKLYTLRSGIVHGSREEPPVEESEKFRSRAALIAVEAMRRMYEFPTLLEKTSSDRSVDILLGTLPLRSE